MHKVSMRGHTFFIKRDDLIVGELSGNKARKLHFFLKEDLCQIDTITSYGGIQSNMMHALSCLARLKHKRFIYYTKYIPEQVRASSFGNYHEALKNGMIVQELRQDYHACIDDLASSDTNLLIHQGGHQIESKYGIGILAEEINRWAVMNEINDFIVFQPSGTGTTALYLQESLGQGRVFTTNCVGSAAYLKQQFHELDPNPMSHPQIIENSIFRFAEPHIELLKIFHDLRAQTEIEFDLVYDTVGWYTLLKHLPYFGPLPIVYLHTGGSLGTKTQMLRYERKKLLSRV